MNPPVLMSDAPRCLAVPEVFVGAPAVRVVAAPGWRDAWRGDGRADSRTEAREER